MTVWRFKVSQLIPKRNRSPFSYYLCKNNINIEFTCLDLKRSRKVIVMEVGEKKKKIVVLRDY